MAYNYIEECYILQLLDARECAHPRPQGSTPGSTSPATRAIGGAWDRGPKASAGRIL